MHAGAPFAIALLIAVTAFFVFAEFSAVRVRVTQLEALVGRDPRATLALEVQKDLGRHLSAIQVGIVVCALALGSAGEEYFAAVFKPLLALLPLKERWLVAISSAAALLVMTTLHVVLAELVPRNFAIQSAERWALRTAAPLLVWSRLSRPLAGTLIALSRGVERLFGAGPAVDEHADLHLPSEEELKRMLERSQASGNLGLSKGELIENLFQFSRRTIKEVAIPRNAVVYFDLHRSLEENLALARATPHTRIPVAEGDLDRVVGVVHLKELLWALHEREGDVDLRALARPAFLVPEMRRIQDLLLDFQTQQQHLALVVNEHGGVDGLVTLEDVLEELVGEIQDEFDREAIQLRRTRSGAWLAQGAVKLEQLQDHLGLELESEEGAVSLGGFFQEQLGRVLRVGDELKVAGWRIRVLSMRGLAPGQFLLKPTGPPSPEPGDAAP
jgi:CBS domain containing-hemolysin-like protein